MWEKREGRVEGWCQFMKERLTVPGSMLNFSGIGGQQSGSSGLCAASLWDSLVVHLGLLVGYAGRLF